MQMVRNLIEAHESVVSTVRAVVETAEEAGDVASPDSSHPANRYPRKDCVDASIDGFLGRRSHRIARAPQSLVPAVAPVGDLQSGAGAHDALDVLVKEKNPRFVYGAVRSEHQRTPWSLYFAHHDHI